MNLSPGIRKIATIPTICIALLGGCTKQPEVSVVARKATSVAFDTFEKIAKNPNIEEQARTALTGKIKNLPAGERFEAFKLIADNPNTDNATRKVLVDILPSLSTQERPKGLELILNNPNIDDGVRKKLIEYSFPLK